ncbi:MAG: acetoacetate--CoA ligase [Myxococcota bacterium]|nr:acetoacetate--CoA ligase [Myxococcales bacterium]
MQSRPEIVWPPPPDALQTSRIGAYMSWLARKKGLTFDDYQGLWHWSVQDLSGFWGSFAEWIGVRWRASPDAVLANRSMPGAVWFPGGELNWAEHAMAWAVERPNAIVVDAYSQTRPDSRLRWADFEDAVARCRTGLRRLGVGRGDRVCCYAPNVPETLVAFVATASLGAIWSSCAPEFGTRSVIDRFAQIEPKLLLAIDGYRYGEREIDRREEVRTIEAALPTIERSIHIRYLGTGRDDWSELLSHSSPLVFESVPFDHPLYVLYSSGTTGKPKAIVHGHGGIVLEHLKVCALHHDLSPGDRFGWFTTTGWMMWNYLVSGLLVGASLTLFDGDPGHPDLSTLWRIIAESESDVFGLSAPFIMASRKAGIRPDVHRLRALGSTGSPLPPEGFHWVHDTVGSRVQPCSVSGGTDVCTAFVGTAPILPVRAGEIPCRLLGVAATAFDHDGRECLPGVQGELVITEPMPSMPVAFWGDPDGEKLTAAYYADYPGAWRHGDWITFMEDGACILSGRSDATLNRGGVRLGTAEFYAVVEELPEIADSLVVHLDDDPNDAMGRLLLFVRLVEGGQLDDELRTRIAQALRRELSPRHVPDEIEAVPGIPRTLSGKKLEVPVKRILRGDSPDVVASRSSLSNPDSLKWFEAYRMLRSR